MLDANALLDAELSPPVPVEAGDSTLVVGFGRIYDRSYPEARGYCRR